MKVVTHPGRFHADEVFAVATLQLAHEDFHVTRTRDESALHDSDARVDIGGIDDPEAGCFDHHQRGGAGSRPNGIPYASFGLVWRRYGAELAPSETAAAEIDRILVQPIDAIDNGRRLTRPVIHGVEPFTVTHLISSLNAFWDEDLDPEAQDRRFLEAVALARGILERQIAEVAAHERAEPLVLAAVKRARDPRIVELDRRLPWRRTVSSRAPRALFVVCPYPDAWGVRAIPAGSGSRRSRKRLPRAWAGLAGESLAQASGVEDAVYCHPQRFFASASSREGALALAHSAVASTDD